MDGRKGLITRPEVFTQNVEYLTDIQYTKQHVADMEKDGIFL